MFSEMRVFEDGAIMEIRIWSAPVPPPPSRHGYKYSLYYGQAGRRLVGFDNERGKGDHKHIADRETACAFVSISALLADFRAEVEAVRGKPL